MPSLNPIRPIATVFRKVFPFFAPKDAPYPPEQVAKAKPTATD